MRSHCVSWKSGATVGTRGGERSKAVARRGIRSASALSPLSPPEATTTTSPLNLLPPPPPQLLRQRLAAAAAAAAFSFPVFLAVAPAPEALAAMAVSSSDVVVDAARLIPDGKEPTLVARIRALEGSPSGNSSSSSSSSSSGFRVRLATRFRDDPAAPTDDDLRRAWRPGPTTVVVLADPSAPNMLRILPGEATGTKLSRGFYLELAARYGNLFVRREDGGDGAALENAMDVLLTCLESPTGCKVVPGLPDDQRGLTTVFAAAAGFVAGFASRLRPSGFVSWKYGWLVVFSPLWLSLLVNFSLAPILVRTDDKVPILINLAVFAAGVALFRASPLFAGEPGRDRAVLTKEGQRLMRESESESDNSDSE